MAESKKRAHPRTALSLLVQYRFNTFDDFLAEYAVNLSPGGIFIHTEQPSELGTMLNLQFSLKDGSRLIEGMGRVARIVRPGEGGTSGMGVEFVDFDEASMALVRQICEGRKAR